VNHLHQTKERQTFSLFLFLFFLENLTFGFEVDVFCLERCIMQCSEVARFKTGMPVLNGRLGKIARFSPVFLRFRPFFCDFWT
jgi:hypothetical protein